MVDTVSAFHSVSTEVDQLHREKLEAWRRDYNEHRPHSSIGNLTPIEFATSVRNQKEFNRSNPSA